jgi:hypothetical protein
MSDESYSGILIDNLEKGNIVEQLKDNAKEFVKIMDEYKIACDSMTDWNKKYTRAIKLAKLQPTAGDHDIEHKSFPFDGASLAMMPYILEAMLDFNSRAAPELVWADNIVTFKTYGKDIKLPGVSPGEQKMVDDSMAESKAARVDRVSEYSNWQLSEDIPHWRDNQDKCLMMLPCVGTAYKKTYWDYEQKLIRSELVCADKVIFNMCCQNFEDAPGIFQNIKVSRNDLIGYIRGDQGWDIDEKDLLEDQKEFDFIEAYVYIDLDEDGLAEPYYAVLKEDSQQIVCLYPCYDDDTITFNKKGDVVKVESIPCFTQYRFLPDPEGGPMGMGWGILLGPMFTAINTNIRQLLDSGTLSVTAANSGLITAGVGAGRGNRQETGPIDVMMGQLTPVSMGGINGSLRDNIVQMPFAGPSPVLFQLMSYMIDSARSMTNASVNVEANPGEAASLYLARLQQALQGSNAIIMRVYAAARKEFQKIHYLNYKYHDSAKYNRVLDEQKEYVMEDDFDPEDCDVAIAGNPTQGSTIERVARAEANLQMATGQAAAGIQVMNVREATLDLLKATRTENIDKLCPEVDPNAPPSKQEQLIMAEKAHEAELKQRDQQLREQGQRLQAQKIAMESAKEMTAMGLNADKQEAEITKLYMESLQMAVEMGLNGMEAIKLVESTFISSEGGTNAAQQIPTGAPSQPDASRSMAAGSSDASNQQMPPMAGA